ncbi:hypothetical protein [Cupriavidus sp. D39]|uniref:hypothetical protein n=1 Tax=Cupriavidus sp. D39 TaxID=2997877 RepID=UPI002271D3D5|nr:hypothetical protein [Cupriavidus sp. D39]MCY0852518.1 hypothetical protein [Cupriavidus sp. D39]
MGLQTYHRIDLAIEQLATAIRLFLDHDAFAAVITLAGAAEEVLGCEVVRRGQQRVLDSNFDQYEQVHRLLHRSPLKKKDYIREANSTRDALKHFGDPSESQVTVDLEETACWMLVRACENASRLGLEVPGFQAFDDWFYEHVVGI